jgi:hypothetical protein
MPVILRGLLRQRLEKISLKKFQQTNKNIRGLKALLLSAFKDEKTFPHHCPALQHDLCQRLIFFTSETTTGQSSTYPPAEWETE